MSSILTKIVEHKRSEIDSNRRIVDEHELNDRIAAQTPVRNFLSALKNPRATNFPRATIALIAEVKKASPSKGVIRSDFDPLAISQTYSANGADCLSVLTDQLFFQGHLTYLRDIRLAVDLPLLRKDFILDEYQIYEARAAGADAVLLIAECLEPNQLRDLHQTICGLGMTSLIELYDEENLSAVLDCQPELIGINNRDLNTFKVDFHRSIRLKQQIPSSVLVVSESGIETAHDVQVLVDSGIGAMLVGESLMRSPDIGEAVKRLLSLSFE